VTAAGGALVLMYRWDAGDALKIIERDRVTGMSGVPIMAREMINHPDFAKTDTSSLLALVRRRGAGAARSGAQDRRGGRNRAADHGLWHDRNLRDHHLAGRRFLR
jgi:acyl-CoA synthetase (AMP-forming)/AMP-acid ligase II